MATRHGATKEGAATAAQVNRVAVDPARVVTTASRCVVIKMEVTRAMAPTRVKCQLRVRARLPLPSVASTTALLTGCAKQPRCSKQLFERNESSTAVLPQPADHMCDCQEPFG